jgi:hypothetical protein
MSDIQLGDRVKDKITGLTGIAVGITDWLYECRTITVRPDVVKKEAEYPASIGFDEPQLEVIKKGVLAHVPSRLPLRRTGGPERKIR